jgi:cytochrome c553
MEYIGLFPMWYEPGVYRDGRRATDAHQGMRQFAQRLTLQEIDALAAYYATLK